MWNLLKNAFRSLKKNKLSMVGLTFLVFLSTGIFTVLNSATTSINTEYHQISSEGNLHDITISQVYDNGVAKYSNLVEKQHDDNVGSEFYSYLYEQNHLVKTNDGLIAPFFTARTSGNNYLFRCYYLLDIDNIAKKTAIKEFFLDVINDPIEWNKYDRFLAPTIDIVTAKTNESTALYNYITTEQKAYGKNSNKTTDKSFNEIDKLIQSGGLSGSSTISDKLKDAADELYQISGTKDTPLDQHLKSEYSNQLMFRDFNSLEISNSSDKIFYKGVNSSIDDQIDKLVNIDINNNTNGINWNNFSVTDATFDILDYELNDHYDLGRTLSYLPSSICKYDIHYLEKVHLLKKANWPSQNQIKIDLDALPGNLSLDNKERQKYWVDNLKQLQKVLSDELAGNEEVFVKDYRITATWIFGDVPSNCEIDNWTAYFTNVNPEFMEANHKLTAQVNDLKSDAQFNSYIQNHPKITELRTLFIDWMNTLTYQEIQAFVDSYVSKHNNQTIATGGNTNFIIIGSGITPDFIYPIVSITRTTPNPKSECIFFTNNAGYNRVYDGFRGNKTEDYIVAKFTNDISNREQQKILDSINAWAKEEMILSPGIKAAYFANDTSNVLNASAFRIAFIPSFINDINYVSYTLTLFIILLSLVICAIVINRYITINQSILGIMRANGLSKWVIAGSLLPFALIPSLVGAIAGVTLGFGLQWFVLKLLSNYWMLPTSILSINIFSILIAFGICLLIFMGVIYLTSYWVLNKKTVDTMKTDSQDNPNIIAKAAKTLVSKFGIITKFRVAVAFSSIWKLLVLVVMTSMTVSSLVFSTSINNKFEYAISKTNASRNYTYAIKLATPTTSGGQYIPTRFDYDVSKLEQNDLFLAYGASGFNQAGNDSRDNVYLQSSYYGNSNKKVTFDLSEVVPWWVPIKEFNVTFNGIDQEQLKEIINVSGTRRDLNDVIDHEYYYSSLALNAANDLTHLIPPSKIDEYVAKYIPAITQTDSTGKSVYFSNLFIPFMGDAVGQAYDIFYLKNRIMTNGTLNYVVGAFGQTSDPWDISSSLMPENVRTAAYKSSQEFFNYVGDALHNEQKTGSTKAILRNRLIQGLGEDLSQVQNELVLNEKTGNYEVNDKTALGDIFAVALNPEFIKLLTIAYSFGPSAVMDYPITYNTVPIKDDDETYTYLDVNEISSNSNSTIMGVKANSEHLSQYVNLFDTDGNNLINRITYTTTDLANKVDYPILVNAYAAHKYGLSEGSKITFKINNRADRIQHQIRVDNNEIDPDYTDTATFTVKGIFTTYEGEEYFIDQDLANYLLRLKSHLNDANQTGENVQPNNWYANEELSIGNNANIGYPHDKIGKNAKDGLINISNYQAIDHEQYQLTPYGFNGVFTKSNEGGALLAKSMMLYASSGLYLSNDKFNSNVAFNTLKFGANTYMAAKAAGLLNTTLGQEITSLYNTLIANPSDENQQALAAKANELAQLIVKYYGQQVYEALLTGANDKLSSNLVYTNISNTVNKVTKVVIGVIAVMVIIIIALVTNMIINDSKKLAAILKSLGYSDNQNAATYLSIYIPVIIIGLLISIGISHLMVNVYNAVIFGGIGIWINATVKWYYYLGALGIVLIVFTIAGTNGVLTLKRDKLIEMIK